MRRPHVRRSCTLLSLAIAMMVSGAAHTEEPPSAASDEAQAAGNCRVVHIYEDALHGIEADDVVVCDGENPTPSLKGDSKWRVGMRLTFDDLPPGTMVTYAFDHTSSNCILDPWAASPYTERTTGGKQSGVTEMFTVANGLFGCAWERSWASWNIKVVPPSGEIKTANIRIVTGVPDASIHYADLECHFIKGLRCAGGGRLDARDEQNRYGAIVPLSLGPLDTTPPPRAPKLSCTGSINASVGKAMDPNDHHACTIEGYPLPAITVSGLPPGVSLSRWPSESDTWLVMRGTVNSKLFRAVTVTASQSGWSDTRVFWLDVK